MRSVIAVVTKPMQLVTLLSVLKQDGRELNNVKLVVVDQFNDARGFSEAVESFSLFKKVFFIRSRLGLVFSCFHVGELYVDSDFAKDDLINFLSCPLGKVKVYEEGFYNYVPDLSSILRNKKIRLVLYKILGFNLFLGGGRFTSSIYLRRAVSFIPVKKQVLIKQSIEENFLQHSHVYEKLFKLPSVADFPEENVDLYVTSHKPDWSGVAEVVNSYGIDKLFVKLHPKLSGLECQDDKYQVLYGNFPVELLVVSLIGSGRKVRFFHENSSAVINLSAMRSDMIKFIRVGSFDQLFETLFDQVVRNVT